LINSITRPTGWERKRRKTSRNFASNAVRFLSLGVNWGRSLLGGGGRGGSRIPGVRSSRLGPVRTARGWCRGFAAERIPPLNLGTGSYFALSGAAPFKRLIFPPPIPGALGIHYSLDLGGQARFGPDLEFVEALDYTVDPARVSYFEDYVRRFRPGLPKGALSTDYAGIRSKLHGPGEP